MIPRTPVVPPHEPAQRAARLRAVASAGRAWLLLGGKLLVLAAVPVILILLVAGIVYLAENAWLLKWIWIPFLLGWLLAYAIYRRGKRGTATSWRPEQEVDYHWTETDQAAWRKVREFADSAAAISPERFTSLDLYIESVRDLAERLAQHYHPGTRDAVHALTVPEILTAIELATADLRGFVENYVPGSHLLTIRWLRRAVRVPSQWRRLRPLYDIASLLWNPWSAVYRHATRHGVVNPMVKELEADALLTIYQAFILSIGKYLIELNSHRLKAGPDAWRRWMEQSSPETKEPAATNSSAADGPSADAVKLQIVVVGQVKAGKSSLVNALIGQAHAAVDVLPSTPTTTRHTLSLPRTNEQLVLLDTAGYARRDRKADDFANTMDAVCHSAIVLLVLHACQPARQPDLEFLQAMDDWFRDNPQFVKPPILAVVTHIDQLPPPLEWDPPYADWLSAHPRRPKEQNIRAVVDDVKSCFGSYISGVVPACTDVSGKRGYGMRQWVEPALLGLLPQGRSKALVDALHADLDKGRLLKTFAQLWNVATLLAKTGFCGPEAVLPDAPSDDERS